MHQRFSWNRLLEIKLQGITEEIDIRDMGRYKIMRNITQIKEGKTWDRSRRLNVYEEDDMVNLHTYDDKIGY